MAFFFGLRFLAASDAAEEEIESGSGGFHFIFSSLIKLLDRTHAIVLWQRPHIE